MAMFIMTGLVFMKQVLMQHDLRRTGERGGIGGVFHDRPADGNQEPPVLFGSTIQEATWPTQRELTPERNDDNARDLIFYLI